MGWPANRLSLLSRTLLGMPDRKPSSDRVADITGADAEEVAGAMGVLSESEMMIDTTAAVESD